MSNGDVGTSGRLRLGPPQQLSTLRRARFARTPDGQALGTVSEVGGANQILDLKTGATRQLLGKHPDGEVYALSPDGQWAASCGWHSTAVRLWNVTSGQMVHEWEVGKNAFVYFTPNSRGVIITRSDEFSVWDVATLRPSLRLPREAAQYAGHVAFSPDGKLMALEMAPAAIHLLEVATGNLVAKLEDPHGDRASWQGFTPDGAELVVVSGYSNAIHIWDLRAIRAQLKEMNLDWDWPEFTPRIATPGPDSEGISLPAHSHPAPIALEVIPGKLAKPRLTADQRAEQTIQQYRQDPAAILKSAMASNDVAWALVTAPEMLRDSEAAVLLAENALRLSPENLEERTFYRNTLGVAYYRSGRFQDAIRTLRDNLTARQDKFLPFDLYFLAMSYAQLGDADRARENYDWAVRWTGSQTGIAAVHLDELNAFRAEAEALLGVKRNAQ
jgi:tetratricopeptide (TPR) repeat protein